MTIAKPPAVPAASASTGRQVDAFLDAARRLAPAATRTGARLVFALDATASRQPTWDRAAEVQAGMFEAAAAVGGLSVQLVYFRGFSECRASPWLDDPRRLRELMGRVRCQPGETQIGRVLGHVLEQGGRDPVRALIFVGDAVEEGMDGLCATAGQLGLLGVKAFMFHEGDHPGAAAAFGEIARLTGGAALAFDRNAPAALEGLLRAVSAFASGGMSALDRLAVRDESARRLVAALPKPGRPGTGR